MTRRTLLPALYAFFVSIAVAATASAQQIDMHIDEAPICGMRTMSQADIGAAISRTSQQNPALYRRMLASAKQPTTARIASAVGERRTFWILDRAAGMFNGIEATLTWEGKLGRIWIDVRDSVRLRPTTSSIRSLARAIDTATASTSRNPAAGILQNDIDVFGTTPKEFEIGGKTDFLLFDIPDDGVLGYFFPYDQIAEEGSNQMNLLYIDSREGFSSSSSLYNTIGHEFQHLIHYAHNKDSELFYNEGCSEVAGLLNGYVDRYNSDYLDNTNVDLLSFPTEGDAFIESYERAYTLMWFLYEQYGEAFLTEFVKSRASSISRINDALTKTGHSTTSVNAKLALRNFAVANYLLTNGNTAYGYQRRITQNASARPTPLSTTTGSSFPLAGTIKLQRFGIAYTVYNTPGVLRITPTGSREFAVMAMLYRGTEVEVRELMPGAQNVLPITGVAYDKVVLAYINLTSNINDLSLALTPPGTVGVEDEMIGAKGSAIVGVAPMPASASEGASVHIMATGSAPVSLELYDLHGRLLRRYLDHQKLAAGDHAIAIDLAGLEAGTYFVRLLDGEKLSVQPMVVNR